eukprot:scaffold1160_cov174-Ochromonas_danica.AAC.21
MSSESDLLKTLDKEVEVKPSTNESTPLDVEDDWSEDEDEELKTSTSIQLGFLEPVPDDLPDLLFHDPDWRNWDGGKVGGKPIWLDPVDLPNPSQLLCPHCSDPLTFLMEIYCPLDNTADAFHRALYVFTCQKSVCVALPGGMKCFRSQLPRSNPYYTIDPKQSLEVMNNEEKKRPALCEVCGCKALHVCSQCKQSHYCHRSHQKLHWKTHKLECQGNKGNSVEKKETGRQCCFGFPEHEIVVESEELDDSDLPTIQARTTVWEDAGKWFLFTPGGKDEADDAALTQKDYNKALNRSGKKQVLRYCSESLHRYDNVRERAIIVDERDRGRLFVSEEAKQEQGQLVVPTCSKCGEPRAFEFQIMPQLLYYLEVDKETNIVKEEISDNNNGSGQQETEEAKKDESAKKVSMKAVNRKQMDLNWGTVDIYTCVGNCCPGGYIEEHVVMQRLPSM